MPAESEPDWGRETIDHRVLSRWAETLGLSARQLELTIGAVLVAIAVVATGIMARDMWFLSDDWEYLANRSITDLDSYFRPYGGHWTTWSTLLIRGLYRLVGLDFWPWYYLPRLVGHTLLMVLVWRVIRRRGADPLVALLAFASLLFLSASSYQRALQIGNWAVYAALIVSAVVISRREHPTPRDQLIVAAALLVGVLGNGYAAAVIAGTVLALILTRRILAWLPGLLPPFLAYGTWYLIYRDEIRPRPELTLHKILLVPMSAFRIVRSAIEGATGLPSVLAVAAVVVIVGWLVVLLRRRQLDVFDAIVLCTLAAGLALLTIQRVAEHGDAVTRDKYGYSVVVLLVLVLFPHLRIPNHRVTPLLVTVAGLAVLFVNVSQLDEAIDALESSGVITRDTVEAAAAMMDAGEPVVGGPSEVVRRLDTHELRSLVDQGFHPDAGILESLDPVRVRIARGALRINLIDNMGHGPPSGARPSTTVVLDDEACALVTPGRPVSTEVSAAGTIVVQMPRTETVRLHWTDQYGEAIRLLKGPAFASTRVELADPGEAAAELIVSTDSDEVVRVCGLRSTPS